MENGLSSGTGLARVATQEGVWYSLNIEGQRKPVARYEQGASLAGTSLYIVGGNCAGGRYLNDVWVFDLSKLRWIPTALTVEDSSTPEASDSAPLLVTQSPLLPQSAGHSVSLWNDKLFVIGGHTKAKDAQKDIRIRVLDIKALAWSIISPEGTCPSSRGGHTATLVGNKIYMFGGEDTTRRVLGELWVLDLEQMTWSQPEVKGKAPGARSAHVATPFNGRYILYFAGGSVATCFNDLHMLDTETLEWSQPIISSARPTPRAGHSAALLGKTWYIVGGGNNRSGCTEMLALDLSQLAETNTVSWSIICTIPLRSSLSSEGISLMSMEEEGALVAFGGYNGKYHNNIGLYRVPGYTSDAGASDTHVSSQQDQAEQNGSATYQDSAASKQGVLGYSMVGAPAAKNVQDLKEQLDSSRNQAEAAVKEAAVAKENAAHELALMRRQLTTAQAALAETQKSLEDTRSQLSTEQSKSLKLEAEVAELQEKLGLMAEQERELQKLRQFASDSQKKNGGGIWSYISGQ